MSYDPATYVEEIPVKISEKYRPPRKVTLSPLCNYQVNSEVLTSEYDVTREFETLKWLQNLKTYKDNKIEIRKKKIKDYEEEKEEEKRLLEQKQKEAEDEEKRKMEENKLKETEKEVDEEEAKLGNEEICDNEPPELCKERALNEEDLGIQHGNSDFKVNVEDENCPIKIDQSINIPRQDTIENRPQAYNPNMPTVATSQASISDRTNSEDIAPQVNIHNISYPPMLIPTQCSPQSSQQKSPTKTRCIINFADFEGDASDPFDSASLKSINDMEELAKILQNSNIKQKPENQNLSFPHSGTYMNGGYNYNPYSYINFADTTVPPNTSHLFNQLSSYQSKPTSSSTATVPLAGNSSSPFQNDKILGDKQYSQWTPFRPTNSNIALSETSRYKPYNYLLPQNVITSKSSANAGLSDTCLSNNGSFQLPNSGVPDVAVSKRPDLEDFYSRYYAINKKPLSGARSGDSTPTGHQINNKSSLTSSNSVPDLTASDDNEVSKIISSNHFENAGSPEKSMPSRPFSTSGYEVHEIKSSQGYCRSSTNVNKSKLPDPFIQLTEDAQALVQSMSEMGFPRDRVARAVQKLGTDHKKLLEVLLTLQSFQENGEDENLSERAFYYYIGEVSKVNEFLLAAKTLLDLGFEEERVVEKLFKNNNDKEKCLEELISDDN